MHDDQGRRNPSTLMLWLAYASGAFGLAMFGQMAFLVPLRARELGATFEVIGLIVGAGAFASVFASVTTGAVIDRLGPRNSFVLGATASAVVGLSFVLVTDYWWFLPLQAVLGLCHNLGWVASQTYVTSLGEPTERARHTGRFTFFGNIGQMSGPLLVGVAAQLVGFRWALLFPVAYAAAFAVLGLLLAETRVADQAASRRRQGLGIRSAAGLLRLRGMRVALLLTFARLWVWLTFSTFFPVFLVDGGLAPGVAGTVIATAGLVAAVTAPTAGYWTRRWSEQSIAVVALGFGAFALMIGPHLQTVPIVYVVPALIGIGSGLSLPMLLSIVTNVAPGDQRGVALGLRGTVNQLAATGAPVLVGPMISGLGMTLGFTAGGLIGLGVLVVARLVHARDRQVPSAVAPSEDVRNPRGG